MKIVDALLLAAAIVVATALYAAGVRTIRRTSRSRLVGAFLLHVSVALVFLGGAPGAMPAAQAQSADGPDLAAQPEWQRVERAWASLLTRSGMRLTRRSWDELAGDVARCEADLAELERRRALERPVADHARRSLRRLLERLDPDFREPSRAEALALALEEIRTARAALDEVRRAGIRNRFLARRLAGDVRDGFTAFRPYTLEERLEASQLTREEYEAFATGAIQSLADLSLGGYTFRGDPEAVRLEVESVEGEVRCKMPSFPWQPLAPRTNLFTAMLVENRTDREVEIRLGGARIVRLAAGDLRTGWELEVSLREPTEAERRWIPRLVENLGSADEATRTAAAEALLGFGEHARGALREAAARSDARGEQARALLDRLDRTRSLAIEESFDPADLEVVEIEVPDPRPEYGVQAKYGVRPRYGVRR